MKPIVAGTDLTNDRHIGLGMTTVEKLVSLSEACEGRTVVGVEVMAGSGREQSSGRDGGCTGITKKTST